MKYDVIVGIDPDIKKNGVAILTTAMRELETLSLTFYELTEFLYVTKANNYDRGLSWLVVIEAGWLNKSNWHIRGGSLAKAAAIGRSTGMNHQTGILIAEMCEGLGIPYKLQKPYQKCWKGTDGKITHDELKSFTGIERRTNQEERDAVLLAWLEANLPIRIKA